MSIGRVAPAAEGFKVFEDTRSQEDIESDRIVRRVMRNIARKEPDKMDWQVRGDFWGVRATRHETEVYAAAVDKLGKQGVQAEVHRFNEHFERNHCNMFATTPPSEWDEDRDRVVVKAVDGKAVPRERIPQTEPNHVARIYPPEEV